MTKEQASRLCNRVNQLECVFVADVEETTRGFGIKIRHYSSGNEMGATLVAEEGDYMVRNIERQMTEPTQ